MSWRPQTRNQTSVLIAAGSPIPPLATYMRLLTDRDLLPLVSGAAPIVKHLPVPAHWGSQDSPLQPASLDLHVGGIYIPGKDKSEKGGEQNPQAELVLAPGHTAMVLTLEELQLPNTITAFGFPPARVSSGAVLMTNPGHIDPGYTGRLRFTLINMGKEDFVIRKGDPIVTLLFVSLETPPEWPYAERFSTDRTETASFRELALLSHDFLDLRERTLKIAREEIKAAELDIKRSQARLPMFSAIGAALLTGAVTLIVTYTKPSWEVPVQDVKTRIEVLSSQLNVAQLNSRLAAIEARLQTANDTSAGRQRATR